MNNKLYINESAFTLIEVLIAMTIFTVGILAVGSMQLSAIRGNSRASDLNDALSLAQSQLEELQSLQYTVLFTDPLLMDGPGSGTGSFGFDDGNIHTAARTLTPDHNPLPIGKYNLLWNIEDISVPSTAPPNAKRIKLFVQWQPVRTVPPGTMPPPPGSIQIELETLILQR